MRRHFFARKMLSGRNILVAGLIAGLQLIPACASRPRVTIAVTNPDGHSVTICTTPSQLPPNSTLIGWTPDQNGWPVYEAPDGRILVCMPGWGLQICHAVEVFSTLPDGSGGWPYNNHRGMAQRTNGEGEEHMNEPPPEPDEEETIYWHVTSDAAWDQQNDMLTVIVPDSTFESWPSASAFDVSTSSASGLTTISGTTIDVASYVAEGGTRIIRIPAAGGVPELYIDLHVGEPTPVRDGSWTLGFVHLDLMYIRYASDLSLVPAQYEPIRILGRPQ